MRWVSLSQRHLSAALAARGFIAGQKLVGRLLKRLNFSLQANCKTREGANHPDRNAQFEHINAEVKAFQAAGQPVISVDTKKKELVGDFGNGGRELRPKGQPEPVRVHDFAIPGLGKAVPYGIYDVSANAGSSMSESVLTLENFPSRASDAGGTKSAPRVIRMRSEC